MARFSERIGAVKPIESLQIKGMDEALRNSLWNVIYTLYENSDENYWRNVAEVVACGFAKTPADELPYRNYDCREWLKKYFFSLPWYQVYDLMEFIVTNHTSMVAEDHLCNSTNKCAVLVNDILERELSGYRFIRCPLPDF